MVPSHSLFQKVTSITKWDKERKGRLPRKRQCWVCLVVILQRKKIEEGKSAWFTNLPNSYTKQAFSAPVAFVSKGVLDPSSLSQPQVESTNRATQRPQQ